MVQPTSKSHETRTHARRRRYETARRVVQDPSLRFAGHGGGDGDGGGGGGMEVAPKSSI